MTLFSLAHRMTREKSLLLNSQENHKKKLCAPPCPELHVVHQIAFY
jgi:hypothetical protein